MPVVRSVHLTARMSRATSELAIDGVLGLHRVSIGGPSTGTGYTAPRGRAFGSSRAQ